MERATREVEIFGKQLLAGEGVVVFPSLDGRWRVGRGDYSENDQTLQRAGRLKHVDLEPEWRQDELGKMRVVGIRLTEVVDESADWTRPGFVRVRKMDTGCRGETPLLQLDKEGTLEIW